MEAYNIAQKLFSRKETIVVTGAAGKVTCQLGPAGIGMSKARPLSEKRAAKYSGIARALDFLFIDKSTNFLESTDRIYGETIADGKSYKYVATENDVVYENERLHGFWALIPKVLFELRTASAHEEFKNTFSECKNQYLGSGIIAIKDVLLLCDSFYYDIAKSIPAGAYNIEENALVMQTVDAAVRSGQLSASQTFDGMAVPPLTGFEESTKGKAKKAEKVKAENAFDEMKEAKHVIPYNWDEKQKEKIPGIKLLDSFIPVPTFFSMARKIEKHMGNVLLRMDGGETGVDAIGNDYINISIAGKPGTGKTTIAYALGAAMGMPVYTVPLTKNTEEDYLQGMTKAIDGKWTSVETDFAYAYEHGGIIILEEINLADPAVIMGAIGQAIEFPFVFLKDGYKPVRRHPLCVIISTMNIGTYGSKGVNQALSSRFKQTYILNDPSKNDFISILKKSGSNEKECKWVYNAYDRITSYLCSPSVNAEDICLNVTLRSCIGALENISEGEPAKEAIRNTLIGKIAEADLQIAEKAYEEIINLPEL